MKSRGKSLAQRTNHRVDLNTCGENDNGIKIPGQTMKMLATTLLPYRKSELRAPRDL